MLEEILSIVTGTLMLLLLSGFPFILLHIILTRKKKLSSLMEDKRVYWRHPQLASRLSEEQRQKITEEFLELAQNSREENVKRMGKIWKERNGLAPFVLKEMRENPEC